ncbi:MAG: hypothetical protein M0042_12845 [Nitrospiraceae bacterium]|nr:hypothetical protein [Nitrospiraceae bacterium]
MDDVSKRHYFGRGKSSRSTGPQMRFIVFLILVLAGYTLLIRVFQKLALIVELPAFLPIALVTLLLFIGVAGFLYSHTFIGPLHRIRHTLEQLAEGNCSVTLRLREHDDPLLKEIVQTIIRLCENTRSTNRTVLETARDLLRDLASLRDRVDRGASKTELKPLLDQIDRKRADLEKALTSVAD